MVRWKCALLLHAALTVHQTSCNDAGGQWWLHLDILISNLDVRILTRQQKKRARAGLAGALGAVCGEDLSIMSLEAEAGKVTLREAGVCTWSPLHWHDSDGAMINAVILVPAGSHTIVEHAIRSEQFESLLAGIFQGDPDAKSGRLEVRDVAMVPLTPEDGDCSSSSSFPGIGAASAAEQEAAGEAFFRVERGCSSAVVPPGSEGPRFVPEGEAAAQVICCTLDGSTSRHAQSQQCLSSGGDAALKTYTDAVRICSRAGMRLCESQEQLDRSCGQGCGLDSALVWTSQKRTSWDAHVWARGELNRLSLLNWETDWRVDVAVIASAVLLLACCWWLCLSLSVCFRSYGCCKRSKRLLAEQEALV